MSEKSHVSMEQHMCVVCGKEYDTGAILLHKRLRKTLDRHTTTGYGLCPEHQKLFDDGYIALVEATPDATPSDGVNRVPLETPRTGRIAHIRRKAFDQLFSSEIPEEQTHVFVEHGLIDILARVKEGSEERLT